MDSLAKWVKQLVIALMLTGFLEMFLPENGLKKVAKLVTGLIIMMVLIGPLVRFLHIPLDLERVLPGPQDNPLQTTSQVISRGLQIRNTWNNGFNSEQNRILREKIESVIGLVDEIDLRKVQFKNDGTVQAGVVLRVAPVNAAKASGISKAKLGVKIKNAVRLVSNLPPERIEVIWDENEQ